MCFFGLCINVINHSNRSIAIGAPPPLRPESESGANPGGHEVVVKIEAV